MIDFPSKRIKLSFCMSYYGLNWGRLKEKRVWARERKRKKAFVHSQLVTCQSISVYHYFQTCMLSLLFSLRLLLLLITFAASYTGTSFSTDPSSSILSISFHSLCRCKRREKTTQIHIDFIHGQQQKPCF